MPPTIETFALMPCRGHLCVLCDGLPGGSRGAEVDGGGITQLFNVTGAALHLENLLLSRGATNASGAAVSATDGANISVHNCAFSGNTGLEGAGGATHVVAGPLQFFKSISSTWTIPGRHTIAWGGSDIGHAYILL